MDKVYKSRVAKWYIALCIAMTGIFVWSIFLCYNTALVLIIDAVLMGISLFMIYDILLHTDYTIKGDKLYIRCGVLFRATISIFKITAITHKSTFLSSPALSAKRIGIKYGKTNCVYVSPKNKEDFISSLLSINPNIKMD